MHIQYLSYNGSASASCETTGLQLHITITLLPGRVNVITTSTAINTIFRYDSSLVSSCLYCWVSQFFFQQIIPILNNLNHKNIQYPRKLQMSCSLSDSILKFSWFIWFICTIFSCWIIIIICWCSIKWRWITCSWCTISNLFCFTYRLILMRHLSTMLKWLFKIIFSSISNIHF